MKNIEAILKDRGVDIPAEIREEFLKEFNANYKTIAEYEKLTASLANEREKLEQVSESLKKFDGYDPDAAKQQAADLQKKLEETEKRFADEIAARDNNDALERELSAYEFSSKAARASILAKVKDANLTFRDGAHLGFAELMEQIKAEDADAFKTAAAPAAKFTERGTGRAGGPDITREQILAIRDASERQAEIDKHRELFPVR